MPLKVCYNTFKQKKKAEKSMYYRHDLDIQYPERSDEHMITVEHLRDVNCDENYPYANAL